MPLPIFPKKIEKLELLKLQLNRLVKAWKIAWSSTELKVTECSNSWSWV